MKKGKMKDERIRESQIRKQKSQFGPSNLRFLFSDLRFKDSSIFEFSVLPFSLMPLTRWVVIRIRCFLRRT